MNVRGGGQMGRGANSRARNRWLLAMSALAAACSGCGGDAGEPQDEPAPVLSGGRDGGSRFVPPRARGRELDRGMAGADAGGSPAAFDGGMDASPPHTVDAPDAALAADATAAFDASRDPAVDATLNFDATADSASSNDGDEDAGPPPAPMCRDADESWVAGASAYERAESVSLGHDGSVYVAGAFAGSLRFGATELNTRGGDDAFLVKYRVDGSIEWARSAGGTGDDAAYTTAVLADGSVYVSGHVASHADFEGQQVTATGTTLFLAKYDANGALRWIRSASGCAGKALAALPDGSVVVTGAFLGTCQIGTNTLTSAGAGDVFVAKFAADGSVAWAQRAGGGQGDSASGIAVLPDGASYVVGEFWGPARFGSIALTPAGGYDMFVAMYGPEGQVRWAQRAGGAGFSRFAHARAVAADGDGSAYVTGQFGTAITFGSEELTGGESAFVAKYAADGTVRWARNLSGNQWGAGLAIAVDRGGVYVTGGVLGSGSRWDMFLARLHPHGEVASMTRAMGTGPAYGANWGRGIALGRDCSGVVVGDFTDSWRFQTHAFTAAGSEDIFVSRFRAPQSSP